MSNSNVDALRALYLAWASGRRDDALTRAADLCIPDLEIVFRTLRGDDDGRHRGVDAQRAVTEWLARWESFEPRIESFLDWGSCIVVSLLAVERSPLSGDPIEVPVSHFWHFRRTKAVRLVICADSAALPAPHEDAFGAMTESVSA